MPTLRVNIQIDEAEGDRSPADDAVVRLTIRDTSEADALHPVVAESVTPGPARGASIEVPDDALHEGHRYSLFVHVDRVGDGDIHQGDLITTANVAVTAADVRTDAAPVTAALHRV